MLRRFVALAAGMAVGLGTAVPAATAAAAPTLAATGGATAVATTTADLNGVVYRDRVGARWFFEWSTDSSFDSAVATTTPVALHGRLVAVERAITGLVPSTTYFFRVVVVTRQGTRMEPTFGAAKTLVTSAAPAAAAPAPGASDASGSAPPAS